MSTPLELYESEEARNEYTDEAVLAILALFLLWAQNIEQKTARFERLPQALQEQEYRIFERELLAESRELTEKAEQIIRQAMQDTAEAVEAEANRLNTLLIGTGLAASLAPSVVNSLTAGTAYHTDWNLTAALRSHQTQTQRTLQQIIAGARSQGMSLADTAHLVAQYLNPSRKTPSLFGTNGNRLYPPQAPANLQRLARTLVDHSYQQSLFQSWTYMPRIVGYMWIAAGAHPCPACQAKDGTIYSKYTWDFDHPNGQCIMRPITAAEVNPAIIQQWNQRTNN